MRENFFSFLIRQRFSMLFLVTETAISSLLTMADSNKWDKVTEFISLIKVFNFISVPEVDDTGFKSVLTMSFELKNGETYSLLQGDWQCFIDQSYTTIVTDEEFPEQNSWRGACFHVMLALSNYLDQTIERIDFDDFYKFVKSDIKKYDRATRVEMIEGFFTVKFLRNPLFEIVFLKDDGFIRVATADWSEEFSPKNEEIIADMWDGLIFRNIKKDGEDLSKWVSLAQELAMQIYIDYMSS